MEEDAVAKGATIPDAVESPSGNAVAPITIPTSQGLAITLGVELSRSGIGGVTIVDGKEKIEITTLTERDRSKVIGVIGELAFKEQEMQANQPT